MVELTEAVVDAMVLVKDALKITKFKVNKIEVHDDGTGKELIWFDLRQEE